MFNAEQSNHGDLPSNTQLLKSSIIALATAILILLVAILPAEFGIDPTGAGKALGLKKMGDIKMSLEQEVKAEQEAAATRSDQAAAKRQQSDTSTGQSQQKNDKPAKSAAVTLPATVIKTEPASPAPKPVFRDSMEFTLAPNQAMEIKALMTKGQTLTYQWASNTGKTNYDIHGDSKALSIRYHNYEKGSVSGKSGSITAAFDGSHGWFWRNRHSENQTITLTVNGDYQKLVQVE